MRRVYLSEKIKNLNATLGFTILLILVDLHPQANGWYFGMTVLVAIWFIYEWGGWWRCRWQYRMLSWREMLIRERRNVANSYVILGTVVFVPAFVMMGVRSLSNTGGLLGFALGCVYVFAMGYVSRHSTANGDRL